jgi:hypothetical protein
VGVKLFEFGEAQPIEYAHEDNGNTDSMSFFSRSRGFASLWGLPAAVREA